MPFAISLGYMFCFLHPYSILKCDTSRGHLSDCMQLPLEQQSTTLFSHMQYYSQDL